MTIEEAIKARHSVRSYEERPIEPDKVEALQQLIDECNKASGLNIQLLINEPDAFGKSFLAHYGKFRGVLNYIALVGNKQMPHLEETCGYYGERLVLEAQRMGLNTCWVALTYRKNRRVAVGEAEKLVCVISLGYGTDAGKPHRIKSIDQVSRSLCVGAVPEWFTRGVEAALLAPTAINQQKFMFVLQPDGVSVESTCSWGPYSKVDLGIVRYHFDAVTENREA